MSLRWPRQRLQRRRGRRRRCRGRLPGRPGCLRGQRRARLRARRPVGCEGIAGNLSLELCNNIDDNCDGRIDDGVSQACHTGPAGTAGVGRCREGRQVCAAGVFGEAWGGEVLPGEEVCNRVDDDCDGQTDEGGVCAGCGNGVVDAGEECDDGNLIDGDGCSAQCAREVKWSAGRTRCAAATAPATSPPSWIRDNMQVVVACPTRTPRRCWCLAPAAPRRPPTPRPGAPTQGGGLIITEYSVSDEVYNAVFQTNVVQGQHTGGCQDNINPPVRDNLMDPFWITNGALPPPANGLTGCGIDMSGWGQPYIRLGGWDANTTSLAYRELGAGRVWLVETDWQDGEAGFGAEARQMMRYMIFNGAGVIELGAAVGFGHHGACDSWNDCNDAATCANAACANAGHGRAISWEEGLCQDLANLIPGFDCNLFLQLPDNLDDQWEIGCNIPVAYDVVCAPGGGAPRCGDGNVDAGEQCDDGNVVPGDGCDANCQREAAPPVGGLIPGIQQNVPEASLAARGWRRCYAGGYEQNVPLDQATAGCDGDQMLLACRPNGAANLRLAAEGARAEVMLDVGQANNAVHEHNGVGWYFSPTWSWGFAPAGLPVNRNSCDVENGSAEQRMCWHTGATSSRRLELRRRSWRGQRLRALDPPATRRPVAWSAASASATAPPGPRPTPSRAWRPVPSSSAARRATTPARPSRARSTTAPSCRATPMASSARARARPRTSSCRARGSPTTVGRSAARTRRSCPTTAMTTR
ncbi:MAG: hypothetical protein R3F43_31215 [bacterium]